MIAGIELFWRRLRNRISRTSWAIRNFGLDTRQAVHNAPGLVLIQIDGLSELAFQNALERGRLPFLKSLIEKQTYKKHQLYSGVPSSTPVVQAELFYGVKQAVPAFCYYDSTAGRIFSMFEGADAREIQARLETLGKPLLKEGSAYADVFTGGAEEAHFCMTQFGWPEVIHDAPPAKLALLMLLHVASLARIVVLTLIELVLALVDFIRGLIAREEFWMELKFVPSRVTVCIMMREIIVMRSAMDLARGLPIVHLNFLGYDEQSHRRGPDSKFAQWTLKGIDSAICRIYAATRRTLARDYDVWVYSDHGQFKCTPYKKLTGEPVQEAISRIFDLTVTAGNGHPSGIQFERARMLHPIKRHRPETRPPARPPIVTALGPLGCVYLETSLSPEERNSMAHALVDQAHIPMVFARNRAEGATVWTQAGRFTLPEEAVSVLGAEHRFASNVAKDMIALVHHAEAGDFFISGFSIEGPSVSFPNENGAHGGISQEETTAFALLPDGSPLPEKHEGPIMVSDLREAAMRFVHTHPMTLPRAAIQPPDLPQKVLRVLTYNVHNCAGMDGHVSAYRIARVIARERPDIVALQEVDIGRLRSDWEDQASVLAHHLEMFQHFHAAMEIEEEQYGDAILSRFPIKLVRAGALPYRPAWLVDEPRGVLWVNADTGGGRKVNVFNTHFGIWKTERRQQADALLSDEWLHHPDCNSPVILCGDFNSGPRSAVYARLGTRLRNVNDLLAGHKPRMTFSGRFPLHSIDHIFVSEHFEVLDIRVPRTHLSMEASDHLPLVVDLSLG